MKQGKSKESGVQPKTGRKQPNVTNTDEIQPESRPENNSGVHSVEALQLMSIRDQVKMARSLGISENTIPTEIKRKKPIIEAIRAQEQLLDDEESDDEDLQAEPTAKNM